MKSCRPIIWFTNGTMYVLYIQCTKNGPFWLGGESIERTVDWSETVLNTAQAASLLQALQLGPQQILVDELPTERPKLEQTAFITPKLVFEPNRYHTSTVNSVGRIQDVVKIKTKPKKMKQKLELFRKPARKPKERKSHNNPVQFTFNKASEALSGKGNEGFTFKPFLQHAIEGHSLENGNQTFLQSTTASLFETPVAPKTSLSDMVRASMPQMSASLDLVEARNGKNN